MNALSKAIDRYAKEKSEESYTAVIGELFWTVVNDNDIYFVMDKSTSLPSGVLDDKGNRYLAIFSEKSKFLVDSKEEISHLKLSYLISTILFKDSISGVVIDMDKGTQCVILKDYLRHILSSATDYLSKLEK